MRVRFFLTVLLLVFASPAQAALIHVNDPSLPASADGFNLTRDTITGFEWLDVTLSVGRSFGDLIGTDGTNEFLPGGDFAGFRHASLLELSGWTASGQIDSLFKNFGFTSTFSSIGGYPLVRDYLTYLGCLGSCGSWGYIYGIYVDNNDPLDPDYALVEAFLGQGFTFGRVDVADSDVFTLFASNGGGSPQAGHYLVRPSSAPEPHAALLLLMAAALLGLRARRAD